MPHAAELAAAYVLTKAATTAGLVLWVRRRKMQTKRRAVAVELVAGPRTPRRSVAAPPEEPPAPQWGRGRAPSGGCISE